MSVQGLKIRVSGDPAHIFIDPVWMQLELLPTEVERLIVELRNAVNTARRANAPRHKFTDLS
jgi:hypothetical protein